MQERVSFHLGDATQVAQGAGYALVTALDERTTDRFTGAGDEVEQLLYGWSTLICLPDRLSHPGSVGTGTVMRPGTLRDYAVAAGFATVEEVPIEHDTLWLYRLVTA